MVNFANQKQVVMRVAGQSRWTNTCCQRQINQWSEQSRICNGSLSSHLYVNMQHNSIYPSSHSLALVLEVVGSCMLPASACQVAMFFYTKCGLKWSRKFRVLIWRSAGIHDTTLLPSVRLDFQNSQLSSVIPVFSIIKFCRLLLHWLRPPTSFVHDLAAVVRNQTGRCNSQTKISFRFSSPSSPLCPRPMQVQRVQSAWMPHLNLSSRSVKRQQIPTFVSNFVSIRTI